MPIFPTRYSLLSAAALGDHVQKHYGFRNLTCRLLIHNVGDTYILEGAAEKYVLKIYRDAHRPLEEINGEIDLLRLLYDGGAKVARPVNDLKGEVIQAFGAAEGTRHGVLFTYAPGTVKHRMTDAQIATVGREMAMIHNLVSGVQLAHPRKKYTVATMITEPLRRIKPAFAGLESEYAYLAETSARVIDAIGEMDLASFGVGYCHFDFMPKNFHFDEHDSVTFFDFDFAGNGYFVNDLASLYAHYFLQVTHNQISQAEADRAFAIFVMSYRTVRTISDAEIKAIPYFGFGWWMFYFGFYYDNFEDWSNFFFGPRFITERVLLIRRWAENIC